MQRLRYLSLALAVCLAVAPASTAAAVEAGAGAPSAVRASASPAVSATQVVIRPRSSAGMKALETRLKRDGATVLERSKDGESLLVEVPEGHGSAQYARDIAAAVPTEVAQPLGYVHASAVPSDPDYSLQWGLPAIGAPAAWDRSWGEADVVVAVIDSGVDLDQPDLVDQIVAGGWDYVGDDGVPDDVLGHGTHVAGIVVAEANNGVLGSGTAPGCRILPMRVLDATGNGNTFDVSEAIYDATDLGVDVINMSLGSSSQDDYVSLAVAYALAHDVVVVAAAGNCNPTRLSNVEYPAREPGVIAVGAIQNTTPYTIASFSQDGADLDVVAPGVYIYSTVMGTVGQYWQGTSMATPFVAGTAALMRSADPTATQAEIAAALTATATDLGTAGRDNTYGYGLIQADDAIEYVDGIPFTTLTTDVSPAASGWYLTAPHITLTPDEPATTYYAWDGGGESVYGTPLTAAEGEHTLSYRSVDAESNAEVARSQLFKVDTADPTVPAGLTATATSSSAVSLSWSAATDATSGVARYRVYRNGTWIASPTSLTYSATGLAPETTYSFTVSAVDVAGNESASSSAENATTLKAVPAITTTSLAAGLKGRPYAVTLAATGGTPITWTVSAGSLPADLALSPTGVISGTPSESGSFTFTAKAENTGGSDTQVLTLVVARVAAPVYRFYNVTNGTHFFTDSAAEADMVAATWSNVFRYEGVAYATDPANNTQPLYRFYNRASGSHFYTASLAEANTILARWSNVYTLDGQTYAVNPVPVAGSVPVYRFYNLRNGSHFYTASEEERNLVIAQWSATYQYEGPAFWLGQ
ncbi:MAG: S8 family serine peptidase [Coriobacteriia bacterium]|nr:S8 family serine peptidase [Coriobacteriia bacterium]